MRVLEFKDYLTLRYPNPNSWRTYWSETKKIAKYKGDLDILNARDKFQALLASFSYSKKNDILPTDDIPHNADPCVTASFRRQCIKHYKEFIESSPNNLS